MLPGENVEKLEGAPNFRQVGTYSTLYFHELELLGFFTHLLILRLLASQFSELVSQQRKASSKCWRRQKFRYLLQTPTTLLLFLLLLKGRPLHPTTHPGQSGSTCGRNRSSMSTAALARQGRLQTRSVLFIITFSGILMICTRTLRSSSQWKNLKSFRSTISGTSRIFPKRTV